MNRNEPIDYTDFKLFMNKVGLGMFYPEKLEISDVMKIYKKGVPRNLEGIAIMFIKNLIMLNFTCRDKILEEYIHDIPLPKDHTTEFSKDQNDKTNNMVNPLDLILAVFKCSSPMLKQILVTKLFMCKLAIPLVFPAVVNDKMIVSIWPLRSLVIDSNTDKGTFQHIDVDSPCQIVSFIRFGRPKMSKSKLINVILTEQYHNTFFNENCPLGTTKRVLSDGMIEIAWYIPSSKDSVLSKVMFLNLRGDGEVFEEQVKLLFTISSVVVLTMEIRSLDKTYCQNRIASLHQANTGVILAVDATTDSNTNLKQKLKTYSDVNMEFEKQHKCIELSDQGRIRSIAMIKHEMLICINELIKDKIELPLLKRLRMCSADVDEDNDCFRKTRKDAEDIMNLIPTNKAFTSIEEQVTPLQGELWRTWSQKNKEKNNPSIYNSLEERGQILQAMTQIRLDQVKICVHLGPFMRLYLDSMLKVIPSKTNCAVFVLWLKHFFEKRSRNTVPLYISKYGSNCKVLKTANNRKKISDMQELRDELNRIIYNLDEPSLGLEHVCREIGQIYEVVCTCQTTDQKIKDLRQQLPMITARMLLLGFPFEIMDGHAVNVPILWVKAVLQNLKDIIGDKKLLALSVLGMQNSGKTTLLNTMFGLQFHVTAGRSSRGVFMQLVPVDDNHFPFHWVLVIDTEGLCAPELGHKNDCHDNKLAAFAIGLGDITIVNIRGENTAEIKDVLQVAVHAFLRMKIAKIRLNFRQSCVFVHQNVSAADSNKQMFHKRQKFFETLDAMTIEAAAQEDIGDIRSFNQVIECDIERDVWYFSDLWCPGYSESVVKLRNAIMFDLTSKNKTYLTVTDTISRIEDLWNGILKDDLVFSFKNIIELKAYNKMERQCRELTSDLEKSVFEFISSEAESSLVNCENLNDLDKVVSTIKKRLAMTIETKVTSMLIEIDSIIDGKALKDVMIQWKQNKQNRFRKLAEDLIVKSKSEINKMKQEIRFKMIRVREQTKHEIEINKMVRQLVSKMWRKPSKETVMKQIFDEQWNTWIESFATTGIRDMASIKDQIEYLFLERFPVEATFAEMKNIDAQYHNRLCKLEDTIHIELISDKHISIHKDFGLIWKGDNNSNYLSQTLDIAIKIFRKIDTKVVELNEQNKSFNLSYVTEIFNIVIKDIDDHNNNRAKNYNFNLLPPFRAMMLGHVLRYATAFFTRLNDAYNKQHSLSAQMQPYKGTAWELFKKLVQRKTEDVIALMFFREAIIKTVEEHVSCLLSIDAQDKLLSLFSNGKASLVNDILVHFAETEDFNKINSYIQDPRAFAESWIKRLTNDYLFEEKSNEGNLFIQLAKSHISNIFSQLSSSVTQASQSTQTGISIWIEHFVKHSNNSKALPLSIAIFVHVKNQKVPDLQNFVNMLRDQLGEMENDVVKSFKAKAKNSFKWKPNPVISIMDKLWGCTEVCMFCREPCMNTDKNHINDGYLHKCLQHRPQGISGMRCSHDNKLVASFCNQSINTDSTYTNRNGRTGLSYNYNIDYPDWDIAPNSNESKYWIWIFYRFRKQLQHMHNAELPIFPVHWSSISKSEALKSLFS